MRTIVLVGAILGLLLVAAPADAAFQLKLDDGVSPVVITDDEEGDAAAPLLGAISTTLIHVGSWQVTVAAAVSKPLDGSASVPVIELHVLAVSSAAGGTLTVTATNTDFGPLDPGLGADRMCAGGIAAAGGSVDVLGSFDTENRPFGDDLAKPSLLGLGPGIFAKVATTAMPSILLEGLSPFSMTLAVVITHTGSGTTSLDARNDPLPEPATLAIWSLLGVAGVMFARRRRTLA